jgi:hypothetical protein
VLRLGRNPHQAGTEKAREQAKEALGLAVHQTQRNHPGRNIGRLNVLCLRNHHLGLKQDRRRWIRW